MQQIVAGSLRGRRLLPLPAGVDVRPTGVKVRSAIFDRLQREVVDARVLDLCAGTGALGIEALSRGASHATFVESAGAVCRHLQQQIDHLGLRPVSRVVSRTAQTFLAQETPQPFDLVLLDPPYEDRQLYLDLVQVLVDRQWLAQDALIVCEYVRGQAGTLPLLWPAAVEVEARKEYGSTKVDYLRLRIPAEKAAD